MAKRLQHWWQLYVLGRLRSPQQLMQAVREDIHASDPPSTSVDRFLGAFFDDEVWNVPQRLRMPSYWTMEGAYLRDYDRADWQHVDARIQLFAAKLVALARKQEIPLYVHSAFRTEAEQRAAVSRGVSKAVWPSAPHCQGAAVDIVHGRYHWDMTTKEWALIGALGKRLASSMGLKVIWGGDWSFYDPAHWELEGWRGSIKRPVAGPPVRKSPTYILRMAGAT